MNSSKADDEQTPNTPSGQIIVDPGAVLVREPGLIVDPRFLAPLRDELTAELGPARAVTALLQIGCMHGLRDAEHVVSASLATPGGGACPPSSPALPFRLQSRAAKGASDALELAGSWPEASEAQAWLAHQPVAVEPVCAVSAGYTSGWLSALFESEVVAIETECVAKGDAQCRFLALDRLAWLSSGDPHSISRAEGLPIADLRDALALPEAPGTFLPEGLPTQDEEAVIHIWGPVMVIPSPDFDEALQAVELLRSDPAATRVSVIVIDLTGVVIDEGFGAAALEQIIDSAGACGAETVLAGVSSLSEAVVASLEHPPILVCKDLHSGIAAGFQVADSQQHLL
ncbi:MAG: hypothetical protein JRH16_14185 [Deltaproteobacteria bacterium]|nr:hypothetical protein [Deltaproteobacteria bacterium]MBW2362632.1 hypothetical protein [Deltaproteobacteria bacterium]